jgi:beta-phosphoglucomutase-like phosphatase (HAD superfamily)
MTHLVMFDIDGTLVDSAGFDASLYAEAVRTVLGVEIDRTWGAYRNVTDSGILEELLEQRSEIDPSAIEDIRLGVKRRFVDAVRDYLGANAALIREIAGARALVEALRDMPGMRVAIATGGWAETARLKLRAIGVETEGLGFASASDAVARTKIMQLAEQRALHGAAAISRTYFGDGAWDQRASAELGYRFVAIGRGVAHEPCFDDFSDREAILECLYAVARGIA